MLLPTEYTKQRLKMLDFYFETERQFTDLIRIIPLENKNETFSPILYNILQSSCGQVENMMRLLCDKFDLKYSDKNFPTYYELLNQNNTLQKQTVFRLKTGDRCKPFQMSIGQKTPFWWKGYNDTKHDLPRGLTEGNLENSINALCATFTLHCVGYFAEYWSENFFDEKSWIDFEPVYYGDNNYETIGASHAPKSHLFLPITIRTSGVAV